MEIVKPFVKWAGGKSSLIPQITKYFPFELKNGQIEKYVEPFVGGGAVLIDILQKYDVKQAYAFDINKDLINCYNVIKYKVEDLIQKLDKKEKEFLALDKDERQKYFYNIRTEYNSYLLDNEIDVKRASEFIFLNRTCFNGLYRVNKNGKFNVPCGKYKNPTICDSNNLRNLSKLLKNVVFAYGDYKESEKLVDENTFVYFDPPYRPLSVTSGFTSYTKEDFNDENQKELAEYYNKLNLKNAKLMLSNSNPKNTNENDNFFEKIYKGFNINEVSAKRMINANAKGRGEISELLITNYEEQIKWNSQINFTLKAKTEALA
ncbi:dNA adenine methylase [Clostridium sp. CAG:354]|jgi:DNA adenine methylase|nr:DNA adenine methylase [Clostridium sp.]MEE0269769.1 DNA adenine methylase [Clostridia bacterium]CDE11185.1 dNA adenine methylase [Clostridium sp. CAG:354]